MEYSFTVQKTGWIHVEAETLEDAEATLQENFGHFYVITETGEELSMGWDLTEFEISWFFWLNYVF